MGCAPINNNSKIIVTSTFKEKEGQINNIKDDLTEFNEFDLLYDQKTRKDYMTIKVELFFSCKELYKPTSTTKGNFILILYNVSSDNQLIEEGKTEISRDNFNPVYIKTFVINYRFISGMEKHQKYIIAVHCVNSIRFFRNVEREKYIGEAEFHMDNLIAKNELQLQLVNRYFPNSKMELGTVKIRAVEIEDNSEFISFNIGIKGVLSRNEIACVIYCKKNKIDWLPIYSTREISQKSKEIFWNSVELDMNKLKYKDEADNKIRFKIYEVLKNEKIKIKSQIEISITEFINKEDHSLPLYHGNERTQYLIIQDVKKFHRFKFYDFLLSNLDIKCFLFWDFSNSKINRKKKESVITKNKKQTLSNDYEDYEEYSYSMINIKDIEEVSYLCNTILRYLAVDFDTDNKLPFFGFGCRLPKDEYSLIECFAITKDMINPEVSSTGIYESIEIY